MGRTKRLRKRKTLRCKLDEDLSEMLKWMSGNSWKNEGKLKLTNTMIYGRGLCTTKKIFDGDCILSIPFNLTISYATICKTSDFLKIFRDDVKLTIHELLALFLIFEEHKKERSFWNNYISSLPKSPPPLPWAVNDQEHFKNFPESLQKNCLKRKYEFENSWSNVKEAINPKWLCYCCNNNRSNLINYNIFLRAYIMVHTRVVYFDSSVFPIEEDINILNGEPCMALCPLLDMLNHSTELKSEINYTNENGLFCQIIAKCNYKKKTQVFVTYGSHKNETLYVDYGFFVPNNPNDLVELSVKELVLILKLNLTSFQYQFIKNHDFNDNLYIFIDGCSSKLKGFLFVALHPHIKDYSFIVFSEDYTQEFISQLNMLSSHILNFKLKQYLHEYQQVKCKLGCDNDVTQYLLNRSKYVEYLKNLNLNT